MPRKTWAGLVVLFPLLLWAIHFIALEAIGTAALNSMVESGLGLFGLERSRVSALIVPFVIPGIIAGACLVAAFKLGEYERKSFEPIPDADPRLMYERILQDPKWVEKNKERDPERLKRLVANYLCVQLDAQMHTALVQGRLTAWGEKSLPGYTDGPFDKIPKETWHEVEIVFEPPAKDRRAYAKFRPANKHDSRVAYAGLKLNSTEVAKEFSIRKRKLS